MTASETYRSNHISISFERSGSGPPLLLLHGFPQTRAMWRPLIPMLAQTHTVIAADLRGYGDSFRPRDMADMSFRAMGGDMVCLMQSLGHDRFHLAGHDRGGRVAHRMALDYPDAVESLTVMDIVPTEHLLTHMTTEIARAYYHWFFLAQPAPFPETLIGHDPDAYFERCLLGFGRATLDEFDLALLELYRAAWRDADTIRCMCDDYRAAIDIDWAQDRADLDRQVTCPSLVLYGADGAMAQMLDVPETWRGRLAQMRHAEIEGGHFFPDQSPEATAKALAAFLSDL